MKKNMRYILIGLVLFLLLGAGVFVAGSKKATPEGSMDNSGGQKGSVAEGTVKSTLKDLIAKGIPQKCTFTDKMEDIDSSGTMYISGNKMRGDFNTTVEGKVMSSHMIYDNNTAYNWADGQASGMMFKMDAQDVEDARKQAPKEAFDPNKVVDYKCTPWIVDASLFTPPANVKFSDLSSMMKPPTGVASTGAAQNGSFDMCATCNNLTGDSKDQCLTAFKCN